MERLAICRICLNTNVSCLILDTQLHEVYEKLTSMPFQCATKPTLICYICRARLYKTHILMQQCLEAEDRLWQMYNCLLSSGNVQQESIRTGKTDITPFLCVTVIENISIEGTLAEVKDEIPITHDEVKTEVQQESIKIDTTENTSFQTTIVMEEISPTVAKIKEETPSAHGEVVTEIEIKEEITEAPNMNADSYHEDLDDEQPPSSSLDSLASDDECLKEKIKKDSNKKIKSRTKMTERMGCQKATGSRRNLNNMERTKIIHLRDEGANISQIAQELHMSRNTVRLWLKRYDSEGHVAPKVRRARPRVITQERLQRMVAAYEREPSTPTRVFADEYECSLQAIRTALRRAGVRHRKPTRRVHK